MHQHTGVKEYRRERRRYGAVHLIALAKASVHTHTDERYTDADAYTHAHKRIVEFASGRKQHLFPSQSITELKHFPALTKPKDMHTRRCWSRRCS